MSTMDVLVLLGHLTCTSVETPTLNLSRGSMYRYCMHYQIESIPPIHCKPPLPNVQTEDGA